MATFATTVPPPADLDETLLFIQCSKATQCASSKQLQRFILSLTEHELKHVIQIYLKHTIVSRRQNGKAVSARSTKQSMDEIIHEQSSKHLVDSADASILDKLNEQYGKACQKKVIKQMQQKNASHTHLLSISPQTLAYSFQFLPFRDLCRIQTTCSLFKYLHVTYPGLCHYYVRLDTHFFQRAMRCEIDLRVLRRFKFLEINVAYYGTRAIWISSGGDHLFHRRSMFECILKRVIEQSRSGLDTIKIDVKAQFGAGWRLDSNQNMTVLSVVMNAFETLPIRKLIWDEEKRSTWPDDLSSVASLAMFVGKNLLSKFPKLEDITLGSSRLDLDVQSRFLQLMPFVWFVLSVRHLGIPYIGHLRSLCLNCTMLSFFSHQWNFLANVADLPYLKMLRITTWIGNEELADTQSISVNTSVEALEIKMFHLDASPPSGFDVQTRNRCARRILQQCFSVFSGLKSFSQLQSLRAHVNSDVWIPQWGELLLPLNPPMRLKSLESLVVFMTYTEFINFFVSAYGRRHQFLHLHHLAITVECQNQLLFAKLLANDYLMKFMKNATNLQSFELVVRWRWERETDASESRTLSVRDVLANLPQSLQNFSLMSHCVSFAQTRLRKYINAKDSMCGESQQLIQKLCELSQEQSVLCSVTLPRWLFHPSHLMFLKFHFGFNDKLRTKHDKVCENAYTFCFV